MQRHLAALVLVLLLIACATAQESKMTPPVLDVFATCRNNAGCVFDGRDLFVDIRIVNSTGKDIRIPLAFLQKRGPVVKLIDRETSRETYTRPNLADPILQSQTVRLRPAQAASLEWVITAFEVSQFGSNRVDISAEITVKTSALLDGMPVELSGTDVLHIVGKAKAP